MVMENNLEKARSGFLPEEIQGNLRPAEFSGQSTSSGGPLNGGQVPTIFIEQGKGPLQE